MTQDGPQTDGHPTDSQPADPHQDDEDRNGDRDRDRADDGQTHAHAEREGVAGPTPDDDGMSLSPAVVAAAAAAAAPPRRTGVFVDADSLRAHVGDLLRAYLGGYQVDAWGNFTFTFEQARVFVTVPMTPIGPQVGVFSITNVEIPLTPELASFLLTTNHDLGFGSFSYDAENRAVWLRHTLLGTTLDAPELQAAVAAIASTAAHFDDRIRDRFGGRAFHDAPDEVQQATKPPEPAAGNAGGYL